MPRRPACGHYRETYHGKADGAWQAKFRAGSGRLLRLPRLPRRSAALRSGVASFTNQHSCHLPVNVIPARPSALPDTIRMPIRWTRRHYPLLHAVFLGMTGLLIGTFAFFGLHTLVVAGARDLSLPARLEKIPRSQDQTQVDGEWFTRFVPFERFLHFLVVTSFLLLVITGMPLKFYYTGWAKMIFARHRRPGNGAHRCTTFGAVVTFFYFALHFAARSSARHGKAAGIVAQSRRPANSSSNASASWLLRPRLDDADHAGLARFCRAQQMVFRQRPEAGIRPLDVLGKI